MSVSGSNVRRVGPIAATVGVAAAAAAILRLAILHQSGRFVVVTPDWRVHWCRLLGFKFGILVVAKSWDKTQDTDAWSIDGARLSPDAQRASIYSSDLNDSYAEIVALADGMDLLLESDNLVLGHLPKTLKSTDPDAPAWLKTRQQTYDAAQKADPENLGKLVVTASWVDSTGNGVANPSWTPAGDLVVVGTAEIEIDGAAADAYFGPGEIGKIEYWVRYAAQPGGWKAVEHGLAKPKPPGFNPAPKIAVTLGAKLGGGEGRQILVAGKPVKLPAKLAAGAVHVSGPWT